MKVLLILPALICLTWILDMLKVRPIHIMLFGLTILITMLIGGLILALIGDMYV